MNDQLLLQALYQNLSWHPSRILTFLGMIHGLLERGSLKLKDLSHFVPSSGSKMAHLAKVSRLMANQDFDHPSLGHIIWSLCQGHVGEKVTIAIDRTHWKFGQTDINYLVASLVIGMISVPLCWELVDGAGNSDSALRRKLMKALLTIVPANRIGALVADREFIGSAWFESLRALRVAFTIRLRNNTLITLEDGRIMTVSQALCLPVQGNVKSIQATLWGQKLWITGKRGKPQKNGKMDEIILASNHGEGLEVMDLYRTRWSIERTFKCLKSDGFDIQRTHITKPDRLLKLFAIAAMAVGVSVMAGAFLSQIKPIKIKKHGRKAWSLFTYGLDHLRFLFKKFSFFQALKHLFTLESPHPIPGKV